MNTESRYSVGLDLGRLQDYSALAVVERVDQMRAWLPPEFSCLRVRHLERLPLGTAYTDVVARVGEVVRRAELRERSRLVVDATGLGAPVVEMLKAARMGCGIVSVTITSGERAHGQGAAWHVPKKDLITGVQVLLEEGRLKIHRRLQEADTLARELMGLRMDLKRGSGGHDDLALAVALACWSAGRPQSGYGGQRLPGI
ncbi:MAG TPA: hypothetical protein VGN17_17650 [Bryobacteraceae bacterium]|jgi:hypothetical protein